jgi:hypothetical protein
MSHYVVVPTVASDDGPLEVWDLPPLVYVELKRLAYGHMDSNGHHRHTPTSLYRDYYSALSVRAREIIGIRDQFPGPFDTNQKSDT